MIKEALKTDPKANLVIIPTKQNPLKNSPGASMELIQAWLEDLQNELGADFNRCKLDSTEMNSPSGINFTSDTLKEIKGNDDWVMLLGSDSALSFNKWKNPKSIISLLDEVWVVPRGNFDFERDSKIIEQLFEPLKLPFKAFLFASTFFF
jgi:nicotinic acid mononucleotide adenylyltransferase